MAGARPDLFSKKSVGAQLTLGAVVGLVAGLLVGGAVGGWAGGVVGLLIGAASGALAVGQRCLIISEQGERIPWQAVAFALGFLTLFLMGDITDLLTLMRSEGKPERSINWLARSSDTEAVAQAVTEFRNFATRSIDDVRSARLVIWTFIALDSIVFIWAYGTVGYGILRSRLALMGEEPICGRLLRWAIGWLLAALVVDWLENLAIGALVESSWTETQPGAVTGTLVKVTTGLFWMKWLSIVTAVSLFVIERFASQGVSSPAANATAEPHVGLKQQVLGLRESIRRIRPILATLGVLIVLLFQPLQIDDLMLSLGDNSQQLAYAMGATIMLGITLWSWARHLIIEHGPKMPMPPIGAYLALSGANRRKRDVLAKYPLCLGRWLWAGIRCLWIGARKVWGCFAKEARFEGEYEADDLASEDVGALGFGAIGLGLGTLLKFGFGWHWIVLFPGASAVIVGVAGLWIQTITMGESDDGDEANATDESRNADDPEDADDAAQLQGASTATSGTAGPILPTGEPEVAGTRIEQSLALIALGVLLMAAGVVVLPLRTWARIPLGVGAACVAVGCYLVYRALEAREEQPDSPSYLADFLPAIIGTGSVLIVGTKMLSSSVAEALFVKDASSAVAVVLAGLLLVFIGSFTLGAKRIWRFGVTRKNTQDKKQEHTPEKKKREMNESVALWALCISFAFSSGLALMVWLRPVGVARHVGALGLLLVLLAAGGAGSGLVVKSVDRFSLQTVFSQVGLKRTPLFGLFALWLIVGQVFLERSNHDISDSVAFSASTEIPEGCSATPVASPTIDEAWDTWLDSNGLDGQIANGDRKQYPLVFLISSGGGIRAGWWSAAAMGDLIPTLGEPCASDVPEQFEGRQIFVASGISGGALGIATHQAAVIDGVAMTDEQTGTTSTDWVEDRLGVDHLSPPLAWFAYVELPQSLLGFPKHDDRASIMEQSWEDAWPESNGEGLGHGLRTIWQENPQLPILALNGTSVDDGCRVLISVFALNEDPGPCDVVDRANSPANGLAGTYGLNTLICADRDIQLSTAALLSARFPLISPPGRIAEGATDVKGTCDSSTTIEVVDGGYRDSNGAETAFDIWNELEQVVNDYNNDPASPVCIRPVFVQILDDFRLPATPPEHGGLWPSLLAPVESLLASSGTLTSTADRQFLSAQAFATDEIGARHYTIEPGNVAPGAHPALGWALSETTREKMTEAIIGEQVDDGRTLTSGVEEFRVGVTDLMAADCP